MRGRPKKEIAVIHNALARAKNDLPPLGMRIMVLLATRVQHDQDLLKHKLRVKEYKEHLGITGGSAYHTLERTADQMLLLRSRRRNRTSIPRRYAPVSRRSKGALHQSTS